MATRSGLKRTFACGRAAAWLLTAAGIAGTVISSGCGELTRSPVDPGPLGKVALTVKPAAPNVAPGKTLDIAITAAYTDGTPVKDGTMISLVNDALGTITPTSAPTTNGSAYATFKAGATTGSSTIKASTGGVSQTASVLIDPTAPTPPPSNTGDAIPISSIKFYDSSPAKFKVTATLSHVSVNAPGGSSGPVTVCWDWTHPPWNTYGSKSATGNMWIIVKINGQWSAGTWEWMAPKMDNHACRVTEALTGQPPFIQSNGPTAQWYPKSGEQIGHMITTITRGGIPSNSQNERTPIVVTTWP